MYYLMNNRQTELIKVDVVKSDMVLVCKIYVADHVVFAT